MVRYLEVTDYMCFLGLAEFWHMPEQVALNLELEEQYHGTQGWHEVLGRGALEEWDYEELQRWIRFRKEPTANSYRVMVSHEDVSFSGRYRKVHLCARGITHFHAYTLWTKNETHARMVRLHSRGYVYVELVIEDF